MLKCCELCDYRNNECKFGCDTLQVWLGYQTLTNKFELKPFPTNYKTVKLNMALESDEVYNIRETWLPVEVGNFIIKVTETDICIWCKETGVCFYKIAYNEYGIIKLMINKTILGRGGEKSELIYALHFIGVLIDINKEYGYTYWKGRLKNNNVEIFG